MIRSALRWLLSSIALLFVVTALTFVLVSLAPGDAARAILSSQSSTYTPEQYEAMRHALGIDQPLLVQYGHWLDGAAARQPRHTTCSAGRASPTALRDRIGPSLSIILGTVLVSGLRRHLARHPQRPPRRPAPAGSSTWSRWSAWRSRTSGSRWCWSSSSRCSWRWLPTGGYVPLAQDPAGVAARHRAAGRHAVRGRRSRSWPNRPGTRWPRRSPPSTSRCCAPAGCRERSIVYKHALRNAAIPVVTLLGLLLISLLSGAVVIESFFSIPGLGSQAGRRQRQPQPAGDHRGGVLLHGRRGGREPAGRPRPTAGSTRRCGRDEHRPVPTIGRHATERPCRRLPARRRAPWRPAAPAARWLIAAGVPGRADGRLRRRVLVGAGRPGVPGPRPPAGRSERGALAGHRPARPGRAVAGCCYGGQVTLIAVVEAVVVFAVLGVAPRRRSPATSAAGSTRSIGWVADLLLALPGDHRAADGAVGVPRQQPPRRWSCSA